MPLQSRVLARLFAVLLIFVSLLAIASSAQVMQGPTTVRQNVHHDLSLPLSVMAKGAPKYTPTQREAEAWRRVPLPTGMKSPIEDAVVQQSVPNTPSPAIGLSFEGLGQGQYGFVVNSTPPDTNGAVGATQYVQWVNTSF